MTRQKGGRDLRTLAGIVDARRSRSSHGALLEMSMLEMERQRLLSEAIRLQRRCAEIAARIGEIERRQRRLQDFVAHPAPATAAQPPVSASAPANLRSKRLAY